MCLSPSLKRSFGTNWASVAINNKPLRNSVETLGDGHNRTTMAKSCHCRDMVSIRKAMQLNEKAVVVRKLDASGQEVGPELIFPTGALCKSVEGTEGGGMEIN